MGLSTKKEKKKKRKIASLRLMRLRTSNLFVNPHLKLQSFHIRACSNKHSIISEPTSKLDDILDFINMKFIICTGSASNPLLFNLHSTLIAMFGKVSLLQDALKGFTQVVDAVRHAAPPRRRPESADKI